MPLLSVGANPKLAKSDALGKYLTAGHSMAPHKSVWGHNACLGASPGCIRDCIFKSGMGRMPPVEFARREKSRAYWADIPKYELVVSSDLTSLERRAKKNKRKLAARLNVYSDVDWSRVILKHPSVQFYDYTKVEERILAYSRGELPKNYYLILSRSELNEDLCKLALRKGWCNAAMVFRVEKGKPLPKTWWGYRVIDGDTHDLRFTDPKGVIVGLRPKGSRAKISSNKTGFIVDVPQGEVK